MSIFAGIAEAIAEAASGALAAGVTAGAQAASATATTGFAVAAHTTHIAAKTADEVAVGTGAPPIVKAATSSLRSAGEAMVGSLDNKQSAAPAPVASVSPEKTGFFAGIFDVLMGEPEAPAASVKLGRSADIYNGTAVAMNSNSPFHADHTMIQVPNVGTDTRGAGMAMSA